MGVVNNKIDIKRLESLPVGTTIKSLLDYTKSMNYMFYNNGNVIDLSDYIAFDDTSSVSSMNNTFYGCASLTTIPLFDTSKVRNMSSAFHGCRALIVVPLFDTSNVTTVYGAFDSCIAITEVPQLDFRSVKNMSSAFTKCTNLVTVSVINTSNVENMSSAFSQCGNLRIVTPLDTRKVTNMSNTFYLCALLGGIDMTYYNLKSGYSNYLAYGNYSLKQLIIREFGDYTLDPFALRDCYHLEGTVNATYNPDGLADGYIYVPRSMVDTLKSATNWSTYADQIRALEDYTVDGTTTGELDESKI